MARTQLGEFQVRDEDFLSEAEGATISGSLQTQIDAKPDTLLELTDTPTTYSGGLYLRSTASGTEWAEAGSAGGGLTWTIISGSTTAQNNYGYLIDASNNDVLLNMPSSPSVGNMVGFCDYKSSALVNTITISGSGENIEGSSENLIIDVVGAAGTLVYSDATRGWELVTEIGNFTQTTFNYQNFVDRGDPATVDWQVGAFTTDATWRDLDCSGIVPSNAIAIVFKCTIKDDAVGSVLHFRQNGKSNPVNIASIRTQVANEWIDASFIVPCDSSQIVEYNGTSTTFTALNITVMGWFTDDDQVAVGAGNVYAPEDLTDNYLIRGDGGQKNVQVSTVQVSDDGEMTNTSQPCFNASVTATQTNVTGDGTLYTITGDIFTENFDQGNNFSNGTFTAPVSGKYIFSAGIRLAGLTSGMSVGYVTLETSNRSYDVFRGNFANMRDASGYLYFNPVVICDMDVNDTAYWQITIAAGTKVADLWINSWLDGALIC